MLQSVAYAVVHDTPPKVYLASDIEVLQRVLALEVVARSNPALMDAGRLDAMRQALLDERWDEAVLDWMAMTGVVIDVYTHLPIFTDADLPADMIGAQLQFTRLFRDRSTTPAGGGGSGAGAPPERDERRGPGR